MRLNCRFSSLTVTSPSINSCSCGCVRLCLAVPGCASTCLCVCVSAIICLTIQSALNVDLDGARCCVISPTQLALARQNGDILLLTIVRIAQTERDATRGVRGGQANSPRDSYECFGRAHARTHTHTLSLSIRCARMCLWRVCAWTGSRHPWCRLHSVLLAGATCLLHPGTGQLPRMWG